MTNTIDKSIKNLEATIKREQKFAEDLEAAEKFKAARKITDAKFRSKIKQDPEAIEKSRKPKLTYSGIHYSGGKVATKKRKFLEDPEKAAIKAGRKIAYARFRSKIKQIPEAAEKLYQQDHN
jgi:hypothetical protein